MTFPDRAHDTLAAVMDAIIGGDPSPSALGLPGRFRSEIFDRLPSHKDRRDMAQLLRLLDSGFGGIVLYGMPTAFAKLSEKDRATALRRMAKSPVSLVRFGFKAMKGITGLLYGNPPRGETQWSPWDAVGYPGPASGDPAAPSAVSVTAVESEQRWEADVVVVGSGAGGGVAAAVLAQAGLDVVVLDKGRDIREEDFPRDSEMTALGRMFQGGGLAATSDGGITLLAGETLGGGTTVNWTTSLPTPNDVREEWDRVAGFDGVFTGPEFEASSRAVQQRFGVNQENSQASPRDEMLEKGLRSLGWHVAQQPRNVIDCDAGLCGSCGMGCRIGAKQSTLSTWLVDASAAGARIVAGADVEKVVVSGGRAGGVVARVDGHELEVKARAVVLAAGALNTPAILLRSGIDDRPVGGNLRLHPVTAVWARFPDSIEPWSGMLQTRYSDEFADLDGEGYGFRIETGPVHPSLPSLFFGWDGREEFASRLRDLTHMAPIGVLMRDTGSGRVKTKTSGATVWQYNLSRKDRSHFEVGVEKCAEIAAAAGAEEVFASSLLSVDWRPSEGGSAADFAERVKRAGMATNRTVYASFHQMGSAAMGSDRRASVVGPENESHRVKGLYVMDGSAFPTPSGVNPMISISTVAHRAARALAAKLT